jgi:parallel beta-helix repeat protein
VGKLKKHVPLAFLILILTTMLTFDAAIQACRVCSEPRLETLIDQIVLSYDFPCPSVTNSIDGAHVTMTGLPSYGKPGEPVLPFRLAKILVPQGEDVESVKVYPGNRVRLTGRFRVDYGKTALPVSANVTVYDRPSEAVYGSADPYPNQLCTEESEQYLKGYRILTLRLNPVTYVPKTGELYYYSKLTLNLKLKETNEDSPFFRDLPSDIESARNAVDNPNATTTYHRTASSMQTAISQSQSYDYVIITSSVLNSSFQPLINWKTSKGVSAKTVLIEDIMKEPKYNSNGLFGDGTGSLCFNDTQAHIRNFIKDAYLNWGTSYVLLGGDDEIIPVRGVYDYAGNYTDYDIPCDMYYGNLDGSWDKDNDTIFGEAVYHWNGPENATAGEEADFFAEVYIGRATVDTPEEAANFVSKTLAYEQTSHASYLNKALMVGQTLDDVTQGANGKDMVTDTIPQYTITRLYDRDGTYSQTAVVNALNSGTHIVNHDGHSNYRRVMGLYSTDVDALTNNQYFLVYSIGCYSAAFDTATSGTLESVAEHFIFEPHGAFAYIGNTRYGWYCPASHDGPGETYDKSFFSVLNSGTRNLGKALQFSKEQEPLFDRWTYFTLNLLGDPETEITTATDNPTAHFKTRTDLLTPPHIGGTVNLTGTAARGTAPNATFSSYTIEFGNGSNPSNWMTTGIALTNNGQSEVFNDTLATWDTGQVSDGTYTLRLTVSGGGLTGTDRWVVTVDKQAAPVCIRQDGKVDPPTAPISRNGDSYTLTGNITCDGDGIIIKKDSVILDGAGYTLQGKGSGIGVYLTGRHNVTIKNITVRLKQYGIYLEKSSENTILGSTTENCTFGIWLMNATKNSIVSNNVTRNYYGMGLLSFSNNNTITDNQVADNTGIYGGGVYLYISSNNSFYHNVFSGNTVQQNSQVYDAAWDCPDPGLTAPSINMWDNGYPSGGNYWSNYNGTDICKGVWQNETGSDGIGDQPYIIDANVTIPLNNMDRYPIVSTLIHDIAVLNMTTSKKVVGTGFNVTLKVWVKNEGGFTETFNITIGATRILYEVVATFGNVTLGSKNVVVISSIWDTSSWPLGNYTLSAYASPVEGENATVDNCFIGGVVTVSIVGDITGNSGIPDGKVDMHDVGSVARLFSAKSPEPNYNPDYDINSDEKIDMYDVGAVARHFGEHAP